MSKTSNPVHDGLGIVARLVVIAMLLGVLSFVLQGCSHNDAGSSDRMHDISISIEAVKAAETEFVALF